MTSLLHCFPLHLKEGLEGTTCIRERDFRHSPSFSWGMTFSWLQPHALVLPRRRLCGPPSAIAPVEPQLGEELAGKVTLTVRRNCGFVSSFLARLFAL